MLRGFHSLLQPIVPSPVYVLDHDRANDAAFSRSLSSGPAPFVRAPQPSHGPDFNRPVEHFHSALKRALREHLEVFDLPKGPDDYWQLVMDKAKQCYKAEGVKRDIETLPALWDWVATSDGGWPPRKLR